MNTQLQSQFDRVETALNTLIDSITSYKPSLSAATSLVEADDELGQGLEQLATHQANYKTLVTLRATSAALDAQIKSSLQLLADTRKELLTSTPLTPVPARNTKEGRRELEYNDLLNYAQRIARFTVPPSRQRILNGGVIEDGEPESAAVPIIKEEAPSPAPQSHRQQQNGTSIPTPAPLPSTPLPPTSSHLTAATENRAVDSLPESIKAWLDPTTYYARFTPWPGEDVIRRGALAAIQGMVESGVDPESIGAGTDVRKLDAPGEENQAGQQEEAPIPIGEKERKRKPAAAPIAGVKRQEDKEELSMGFDLYDPGED